MIRIAPALGVALVMPLALAYPAAAQLIPGRPFRPLFRTANDPASSRDRVDVSIFLAAGHDEAGLRDAGATPTADPRLSRASFGSLFATGLYTHEGRRTRFSLRGGGTTRYYSALEALTPMSFFGAAHWSGPVGRRITATLSQSVRYSPYYAFSPSVATSASDEAADAGSTAEMMPEFDTATDHRATRRTTNTYDSAVRLDSRTGRHSRLEFGYALRYVDTTDEAFDFVSHRPFVLYTRTVGRHTGVSLGYTLNLAAYVDSPFGQLVRHDVNGGLSYARQLPFSRRTRVSLAIRSSVAVQDDSSRFHVGGSTSLTHQFTSDWAGLVGYRRRVSVLEGFAVPFFTFTDGVTASIWGRLVGPLRVSAAGSYVHGTFAVRSAHNEFDSQIGSVSLLVPVAWMLAAFVEGYYLQYSFQGRIGLLPTTPTVTRRYGARAGLVFWLPILR